MRVVIVFATVLVLVGLMVGSAAAEPPPNDPREPAAGGSASPEEGKASPILFRHAAVTVAGSDGVEPPPPTHPQSGIVPDDQYSLNGGSTITIIVPTKRAATIETTDPVKVGGDSKPPRSASVAGKRAGVVPDDQFSLNGGSTITIIVGDKRAVTIEDGGTVSDPPGSIKGKN